MIRLLHTGDVHLDSPFAGLPPESAAVRRRELRETFSAMMDCARKEKMDAVLIAGDLVDRSFVTKNTVEFIKTEFASVDCPVIVAPGNHDPADGHGIWSIPDFSENVFIFKEPEITKFSFDSIGLDVYGFAFTSASRTDSPIAGEFTRNGDRVNVLLCHADMTSPVSKNAPVSKEQLAAFGADYAALGHIHNGESYSGVAGRCVYAYCGCPEGRDFGECGPKGAIIAEISGGGSDIKVNIQRREFCRKKYLDITVPVDGAAAVSELRRAAEEALGSAASDGRTIVRLNFTGTVDPALNIDPASVAAFFPEPFSVTVRDRTSPSLDFCNGDMTVKGEFCRLLAPKLASHDPNERERAVLALKMGLAALSGNDVV